MQGSLHPRPQVDARSMAPNHPSLKTSQQSAERHFKMLVATAFATSIGIGTSGCMCACDRPSLFCLV